MLCVLISSDGTLLSNKFVWDQGQGLIQLIMVILIMYDVYITLPNILNFAIFIYH